VEALVLYLRQDLDDIDVTTISFGDVGTLPTWKGILCISLLEIEHEFLATMDQRDMDLLRRITNEVTTLLWITGADMLGQGPNPSLTLSSGLSRAIMLEQPSLSFVVLDVGESIDANAIKSEPEALSTCRNIAKLVRAASEPYHGDNRASDKEYIQKDRLLYISRFCPDFEQNSLFRRRLGLDSSGSPGGSATPSVQQTTLSSAQPCRLAIGRPGVTESIHFQEIRELATAATAPPPDGFVDVRIRAVSLNAKDVYALHGKVETRGATTALEFSGTVERTAAGTGGQVSHGDDVLHEGDAVVVLAPCHFSTTERVPAWAVHKMLPSEAHTVVPTLPVVYATALYALRERGRLCPGETVLIHSGAGALGLAAIAMAQRMGATVFTTAGSAERRAFVAAQCGLPEGHVFSSRDGGSFYEGVRRATGGRGVDVVVNSLTGDLMHASWALMAPFGRFVEVGKRELVDAGRLDMDVFLRNVAFTAFDLSDLFFQEDGSHREMLSRYVYFHMFTQLASFISSTLTCL
jgi:NADPH:quinone reductase-like Zn-dependent oxidoreductase